jgi:hypothetical protein
MKASTMQMKVLDAMIHGRKAPARSGMAMKSLHELSCLRQNEHGFEVTSKGFLAYNTTEIVDGK